MRSDITGCSLAVCRFRDRALPDARYRPGRAVLNSKQDRPKSHWSPDQGEWWQRLPVVLAVSGEVRQREASRMPGGTRHAHVRHVKHLAACDDARLRLGKPHRAKSFELKAERL
jgi:hypothetical protein